MSDLISRQDAIEAIASHDTTNGETVYFKGKTVIGYLQDLPSAEPKTGKWIEEGRIMDAGDADNILCSECGKYTLWSYYYPNEEVPRYCPNCGAKMEGGE